MGWARNNAMQGMSKGMGNMRPFKRMAAGLGLLALAGCAAAQVSTPSRAIAQAATPAPRQILVYVTPAPQASTPEAASAGHAATGLQTALLSSLAKAHVAAAPYSPAMDVPGTLVLHATVAAANPGSTAARLIIGFGAGQAQMLVSVDVHQGGQETGPAEQFNVTSESGYKPGLILPGGIALATHNIWHLVIGGGIDGAMSLKNGLAAPESTAAKAMVTQLQNYYTAEGWAWPARAA
jgi:hypothetical protein